MSDLTDEIKRAQFDVSCPNCGTKFKASMQDAMNGKTVRCSKCLKEINLEADPSIKRELQSLQRSIDQLKRTLKSLK